MLKHIRIHLALLSVVFWTQGSVLAAESIITHFQGQVEVLKKDKAKWIKAQSGTLLEAGDRIRTGEKSKANALSKEGHKIIIKEKTVLIISKNGPQEWDFVQEFGKTRLKVAKLLSGQSFRVKTPTALCAVRGTEFEVTVLEDRSTLLDVFEGLVGFAELKGASPEIFVPESHSSAIQPGQAPRAPEPLSEEKKLESENEEDPSSQPKQQSQNKPPDPAKDPSGQNNGQAGATSKLEKNLESPEGKKTSDNFVSRYENAAPNPSGTLNKPEAKGGAINSFETQNAQDPGGVLPKNPSLESSSFFGSRNESLRLELSREIARDLAQDQFQSEAVFEQQANQYQEAKTLIDAFGKRVRFEEYLTRPNPESFKIVSLSQRDDRTDFATLEVVANKPLPERIEDAGSLWFQLGTTKPELYAVKQRWYASNQIDNASEIALDGDSRPVNFQKPQFDSSGQFIGVTNQLGFQTVFDHRYQFLNGSEGAMQRLWTDPSFRLLDNGAHLGTNVAGLIWHIRPVLVERYDPLSGVTSSFWRNAFVTTQGSGSTASGKMEVVVHEADPNPYRAHFTEKRSYINFTDSNGNGYLDKGEEFEDLNHNSTRDSNEPFFDVVQLGLNGTRDNARSFNGVRDNNFFSDLNRDGLNNDGINGTDPFMVAQTPWAWQINETFLVDDLGNIFIAPQSLAGAGIGQNALRAAYENKNFERLFRSSEFSGRKIDVLLSPRALLKTGLINTQTQGTQNFDQPN